MILLIDNYDSFSYNLYQLVGSLLKKGQEIQVIRNDEMTVEEIKVMQPERIILSPGPGRPENAGVCEAVVKAFAGKIPILGVCLGHQAICQVYGGKVTYAEQLMHGKQSEIELDVSCPIFKGLPTRVQAARYHSLAAEADSLPRELKVTARTAAGEVMAVAHETYKVYGLQFHPESILTPDGTRMLKNFMEVESDD